MSHKNNFKLKVFVLMAVLVAAGMSTYAAWIANNSGSGFGGGGGGESARSVSVESYVIQGAGFFLESYSHVLAYMREVELNQANPDFEKLSLSLDNALASMNNANATYAALKQLADNTPYNQQVIDALKAFDYDGFESQHGLSAGMFKRVKKFLEKGDIRGTYGVLRDDTGRIIEYIEQLKTQVDDMKTPSVSITWKLNQAITDTLLFGQYVSQIFADILEI
jgi:hypothetical protein